MNRLVVVSGGSKGIGRAIVEKFASEGFDVATCARNTQDLKDLAVELAQKYPSVKILTYVADMSKKAEVQTFVKAIEVLNQPVEVLINNTGFFLPGQIHNETDGTLESMIETNVYSAYHLTRGFVGGMIARRSGYIFNICSTASVVAYTNGGSYCISKFALLGMSKVLREELKPHNVRVTSILPGATLTNSWAGVEIPEERFMQPQSVADIVWAAYQLPVTAVVEDLTMRPQLGDL
jgi:short-subunit dehydrogenase